MHPCGDTDEGLSVLKEEADTLTDYAVEVRYPEEWFEPTLEEAKEAFEIAKKVKEVVLRKLTLRSD